MRQTFLSCALFLLVFALLNSSISAQPYEPTRDWDGQWITSADVPDEAPSNLWICFRKTINVDQVPEKVKIRIACDSKYWLWINGKTVVFEGSLKRGPTPKDSYYDVVDFAPHLVKGKNSIAILQWYFGKEGFSHKNSGQPGLLVDGKIGNQSLLSDGSWLGRIHPAFERVTADPQPNWRLPESNIRFNAQLDFENLAWTTPEFNDSDWQKTRTLGRPPEGPWGELYVRLIPLWKDFGLKEYENNDEIPAVSDGSPILCKLPYNAQVNPYFKIETPAGNIVDIRTDDYMGGSEYNVRAEYVSKSGVQEYESLGWMNGHTMIYTFPKGVKILSLKYRETGYNTEFDGSFTCDDPFYNRLWEKAVRTLYVTMRDTYMDCPDRERSQWWGDEVNELGEAFYALDDRSKFLARKGIYELMRWQRADGTIYSPVPNGNWNKELPLQMLASVGHYGFYTWCYYADDRQPVIDVYPNIKKYMDLWKLGDDGLTIDRKGDWTWGDWGENIDRKVLTACWHKLALLAQLKYMQWADQPGDREEVLAKIRSLDENFNRVFWTGTEYRDPEYQGKTDDRVNAMAVLAGFAREDKYPAIRQVLDQQRHASPYMEKYVLECLFRMGFPDDAMARMKERYKNMVEHPDISTLWEGWGIGAEGFGGGSINHAWSGGGLTCLAQFAMGLEPTKPGFDEFSVRPQPGPLKNAKLVTPTRFGEIVIELKTQNGKKTLTVVVPEGTTAEIQPPFDVRMITNRNRTIHGIPQKYTSGTWVFSE